MRTWMTSRAVAALLLSSAATAAGVAAAAQGSQKPAAVRFTTEEAFDASRIPPYAGNHEEVYRHIDANLQAHLEHLRRWVRQPSVSAQNRGISQMADMLAGDLRQLGFKEVEIVPTAGHSRAAGLAGVEKYYVDFLYAFSEMR